MHIAFRIKSIQKHLYIKPLNIFDFYSSLTLEHEKNFDAENENCKMKESATDIKTLFHRKCSNLLLRKTSQEKIVNTSITKKKIPTEYTIGSWVKEYFPWINY